MRLRNELMEIATRKTRFGAEVQRNRDLFMFKLFSIKVCSVAVNFRYAILDCAVISRTVRGIGVHKR